MNNLKIALFTGNYNHIRDGVSLTLNRLVRFLESHDVEVMVFGPTVSEPALEHAGTFLPVPSISAPGREEYRVSLFFPEALRLELDDFKPDIIHVATPDFLGLSALRYAKRNKIPLVSSYHTHFVSYLKYYRLSFLEPFLWKYMKWYYRQCVKVFVPSRSMLEWLVEKGFDETFTLWSRGVDTKLFNPDKRDLEWRRARGIKDDDVVIGFVSRLVWEKDLRTVIDSCKMVQKQQNNVKVLIGGDGPARDQMAKELPEAIYEGFQQDENLVRVYANADVFLFPSDTESFGNVTLEAMACGLPAVVANAVGSSSIVIDGETGLITPPKNVEAFARNLLKLTGDKSLREKMATESRKRALTFEWDVINGKLLNDYHDILE